MQWLCWRGCGLFSVWRRQREPVFLAKSHVTGRYDSRPSCAGRGVEVGGGRVVSSLVSSVSIPPSVEHQNVLDRTINSCFPSVFPCIASFAIVLRKCKSESVFLTFSHAFGSIHGATGWKKGNHLLRPFRSTDLNLPFYLLKRENVTANLEQGLWTRIISSLFPVLGTSN